MATYKIKKKTATNGTTEEILLPISSIDGLQTALDGKQASGSYATTTQVNAKYTKPSTGIPKSDLASAVQTSLGKADTAVQTETDPTVPTWAKASSKPTYTASEVGAVPTTRKVNGKALSADITLSASDVGALPSTTSIPDSLSDLASDSTHRTVTDAEKTAWNAKATTSYVDNAISGLVNSAPEALNTLGELATAIEEHEDAYDALLETVGGKASGTHTHTITSSGSVSSTFTGAVMTSTGKFTPAGSVSKPNVTLSGSLSGKVLTLTAALASTPSFTGTAGNVSVSGTTTGSVSSTFTGTSAQSTSTPK